MGPLNDSILQMIHSTNHTGQERHTGSVIPGQQSHITVYLSIYIPSLLYNSSCFNPFQASYALCAASISSVRIVLNITQLIFQTCQSSAFYYSKDDCCRPTTICCHSFKNSTREIVQVTDTDSAKIWILITSPVFSSVLMVCHPKCPLQRLRFNNPFTKNLIYLGEKWDLTERSHERFVFSLSCLEIN